MSGSRWRLRAGRLAGALVAYGGLAAFVGLLALQVYRWFRQGEWTHIGVNDALHGLLTGCCVHDGSSGRLAAVVQWIEAPGDWLGLHTVLDVVPASLALFALSIAGNWVLIYCDDRLREREPGG